MTESTSTPRDLVLGFASRLPPAVFAPFFESLRATGYRGRTALVLAGYHADDVRTLAQLADLTADVGDRYRAPDPRLVAQLGRLRTTFGARKLYPPLFRLLATATRERDTLRRWADLEFAVEGPIALRHGHFYDFLLASGAERILLTDVRDVLFQGDPFTRPLTALEVFLEGGATVGTQINNRRWIRALYGRDGLRELANRPVSCAGTVIGPRAEILQYLAQMHAAIIWRRRPLGPHDQGVHNHLLHTGRLGAPRIIANEHGRVLTMGQMGAVRTDCDGMVINADGSRPEIVHQFDRHPAVAARLLSLLAPLSSGGPGEPQ